MNDVPRQKSGSFEDEEGALAAAVAVVAPVVEPAVAEPAAVEPLFEPEEPAALLCCACATAGRLNATIDATRTSPFIVPSSSAESRSPVSRVAPWVEAQAFTITSAHPERNAVDKHFEASIEPKLFLLEPPVNHPRNPRSSHSPSTRAPHSVSALTVRTTHDATIARAHCIRSDEN
jgi:hypothetical protein